MPDLNGIPESTEFRRRIGRTGLTATLKKSDPEIEELLKALQQAEYWRTSISAAALPHLRAVRKACLKWMSLNPEPPFGKIRAVRPHIRELVDAVHARISTVVEIVYAAPTRKSAKENLGLLRTMHDHLPSRLYTSTADGEVARGGRVGKRLDADYQVERLTGRPAPADLRNAAALDKYKQAISGASTMLPFEAWIEQVLIPQDEEDQGTRYFAHSMGGASNMLRLPDRVKQCDKEERKCYVLTITAGQVKDASGNAYHTGTKETHFSGEGWAIYVVGMDNTFYSASHVVNKFHHSSFLAGGPVQGAGEIAVDQGRIVAITNKTGHYKAGPAELTRTLFLLHRGGVQLDTIKVTDPFPGRNPGKIWLSGKQALLSGCVFDGAVGVAPPPTVLP